MRKILVIILVLAGLLAGGQAYASDNILKAWQKYEDTWYEFAMDHELSQPWQSLDEVKAFLLMDDTNTHIYYKADKDGIIRLVDQCEEFAIQLSRRAEKAGKRIEIIPINELEYWRWYGRALTGSSYHMINMAIIGNDVYYIEPQTDKIWLAMHLD